MKLRLLCEKLLTISHRFFGIPPLGFYALADGIKNVLSRTSPTPTESPPASQQLELLFGAEGSKI